MTSNLNLDFAGLTLSEQDDKQFEDEISKFPSSFDLKLEWLTKPRIKVIHDTLIGKLGNGFVLRDEEVQVYNLISFLAFKLRDTDAALEYNGKALSKDRLNGIAVANRARFNRHQLKFFEAEEDLKHLEAIYANDNAGVTTKMIAKGELAQSYARFGPKYHELAISTYETIFENHPRVSKGILILWKYDYCLTLRRTLNLFNQHEYSDRLCSDTLQKACTVLTEIIDTSNLQIYTARAWAELGQLVFHMEKCPISLGSRAIQGFIPDQKRCASTDMYFDRALQIGNRDFDVMEVCAKFYRYLNKTEEAINLFKDALKLRKTSLGYHHLALSIKKMELRRINQQKIQHKPWQQKRPGFGRGNGRPSRTSNQKEESNLKRSIKSGRNATPLPWNEQTEQILDYLKLALKQDPHNHFASYDMGFVLRQLGRIPEAKDVYCGILNSLELGELKISCYEQAGYCCLDLAETDTNSSKKYYYDAIMFLQRAIEVAAALAAKVKYTTSFNVRALIPTVKVMLTTPDLIQTHDNHLQRLQNLLVQHGKLLPIAKEANSDENKDISKLLEVCLQENRTDDASLLCVLKEILSEPDEDRFANRLKIILMSASTSFSNGEYEAALTRYEICYRLMGLRALKDIREYDVFLMTDGESVNLEPMAMISEWLDRVCGLRTVNSDENIASGEQEANALMNFCQLSTAVFVVLKDPKIDQRVQFVTTAIISMEPEEQPKLLILKDKSVKLPPLWKNIPTVLLPELKVTHNDLSISSWISNVFKALIA